MDTAEFAALNRQLVSFFRRRCPPSSDPLDLAANTWLGVVRWYRGKCPLRQFAFLVAGAELSDHWRKRKIATVSLSDETHGNIQVPAANPNLDSLLMLAARHEAMEGALNHVADHYRDVIVLWLEGRDNYQIAAELGIAYHTVRSRMSRGKVQLLTALVGIESGELTP